jgi:hypothetical protein
MKIAYGYQILSDDDEYIRMAENASLAVAGSGIPGNDPARFTANLCVFY